MKLLHLAGTQTIIIKTPIIIMLLVLVNCALFSKKKTVIEPLNTVLIDESRVENMRVRHIFRELLLKSITDQNKQWLTVLDIDTLSRGAIQPDHIKYFISFDIMEYRTYNIEGRIDKIVCAVKILQTDDGRIMASFVESTKGTDIEDMCCELMATMSSELVITLSNLQKRTYEVPDVLDTPEDTLQAEE
jgi:hypothetical protein